MSVNKLSLSFVAAAVLALASGTAVAQPTAVAPAPGFPGAPAGAGPAGAFGPQPSAPVVPPMVNQPMMQQAAQPAITPEQQAINEAMAKAVAARGPAPTVDELTKELTAGGKPRNPLEEVSKLNAEVAALRAKLQIVEIKAQIRKKEEELAPPIQPPKVVYVEKKVESKAKEEAKVDKPKLPPLPDLSAIGLGVDKKPAPAAQIKNVEDKPSSDKQKSDQKSSTSGSSGGQGQQVMTPKVVAIEGVDGDLSAELYADWGGQVVVKAGDSFGDYRVSGITPNAVFLIKKDEKVAMGYGVSKASMMQGNQNQGQMGGMMGTAPNMGSPMLNAINSAPISYPAAFDPSNNNGMISTPDGKLVPSGGVATVPQAGVPMPVPTTGAGVDGLLGGLSGSNLNALK